VFRGNTCLLDDRLYKGAGPTDGMILKSPFSSVARRIRQRSSVRFSRADILFISQFTTTFIHLFIWTVIVQNTTRFSFSISVRNRKLDRSARCPRRKSILQPSALYSSFAKNSSRIIDAKAVLRLAPSRCKISLRRDRRFRLQVFSRMNSARVYIRGT